MQSSRITSKYQATIPSDVRAALGVGAGDRLRWEVCDDEVRVRAALKEGLEEGRATVLDSNVFWEWLDDLDDDLVRE